MMCASAILSQRKPPRSIDATGPNFEQWRRIIYHNNLVQAYNNGVTQKNKQQTDRSKSGCMNGNFKLGRCGLVVDTWLRDQKVPGSSPGYARSTLSPWERLFTCIFLTPLMCKVPDYRQYLE